MKTLPALIIATVAAIFTSCQTESTIDDQTYARFVAAGEGITNRAQAVLLAHVSQAMQAGGPEHAVEFCNLQVSSITDSLEQAGNVSISRISAQNRNPENGPKNKTEENLLELFAQKAPGTPGDTLIRQNGQLVYYKTIRTAMPACMNCHGEPGNDIQPATLEKIKTLYPDDRATGYTLNDFRGLWKVEFAEE